MNRLPLLLGLAHGISDAAAGMLVMRAFINHAPEAGLLVLLYNGLAFGFQPVTGFVLDRLNRPRQGSAFGLALTAAGLAVFGANPRLGMALTGFGSSLLHAGGGGLAITATPGKASAPGVFAAFGVIGLAFGAQFGQEISPLINGIFIAALLILALTIAFIKPNPTDFPGKTSTPAEEQPIIRTLTHLTAKPVRFLFIAALLLGIGLRSYTWTGVSSPIPDFSQMALWVALAAGAGKLLGGLAADKIGWQRFSLIGLTMALILFLIGQPIPGVFFLQALTGLSIAALGQLLPGSPALAASLVLGAGVVIGGLPYMLLPGGWFGTIPLVISLLAATGLYWWSLKAEAAL